MHLIRSRRVLGILALAPLFAGLACHKADGSGKVTDDSPVVATVGDTKITARELEQIVNEKHPFLRKRYADHDKLKELLDETVRFETLAQEAQRRGYDKDPDVVRAMKQQMIAKLMQKDFEGKQGPDGVSDADIARYYSEHNAEFNSPESVRVSEIVTHDESKAKKAFAEAKAHAGPAGADLRAFRDLVMTYSEDDATKTQGGDLGFVTRSTATVPKPVLDAAFSLTSIGDISEPVSVDGAFVVLLLTQRRPAVARTLEDAKNDIRQRLFRNDHDKALVSFVNDLEKKAGVQLKEENLDKVHVATNAQPMAQGGTPTPAR
jgi:peptidyl-prolyl cis-trans isomerase C